MGAFDSLHLHSPDSGHNVVPDGGSVALEGQRLHLVLAKRGKPFLHPGRHSDFVGGLVCAFVDGGSDLGQLLADFLLRGTVDTALALLPGAGVPAYRIPGFPEPICPLPDGARRPGRCVLLFLALIFPPAFGKIEGQLGRTSLTALIAGLGVGSAGVSFFICPNTFID